MEDLRSVLEQFEAILADLPAGIDERGEVCPRVGVQREPSMYSPSMSQRPTPTSDVARPAADVPPPAESPDGVDLTLIRWTLSLTPLQRLELLQDWVDGLTELRHGRVAER